MFPSISATYVKVYVLENGMCLSKKKTKVVKKTLDPTFQQTLMFDESPQGKVLQVSKSKSLSHSCTILLCYSNIQQNNIRSNMTRSAQTNVILSACPG